MKLSNMRAYFEQPILNSMNKDRGKQLDTVATELQKQSVQAHLQSTVAETFLNPLVQSSRYVFLCPKMLMWESEIDEHKRQCYVMQAGDQLSLEEDVALMEFDTDGTTGLACFMCGAQKDEL